MEITEKKVLQVIGVMLCVLSLQSVSLYTHIKVSNTLFYYVASYSTICVSIYFLIKYKFYTKPAYIFVVIYLVWALICIFKGFFEIHSYWIFNQLIRGAMATMVPTVIFLYAIPQNAIVTLRILNRFLIVAAILFFVWVIPIPAYAFFLVPFFTFYVCFFREIPLKWRLFIIATIIVVNISLENRTGVLKAAFGILMMLLFLLPNILRMIINTLAHATFYIGPIVLIILGWTGTYNIFNPDYNKQSFDVTIKYNGENLDDMVNEQLTVDTRTFIYLETVESAINHDHLWTGRSPARGYSSPYFYNLVGTPDGANGIDKDERFLSEVGNMNTFNWQGLIGVFIVFFMYVVGTSLGLYCSRNKYVKMIAVLTAFQWAYGWIENVWQFSLVDIFIFIMLGMCYSPLFRNMTDLDFKIFLRDLFAKPSAISSYEMWKLAQLRLKLLMAQKILKSDKS